MIFFGISHDILGNSVRRTFHRISHEIFLRYYSRSVILPVNEVCTRAGAPN